MKSEKVKEIKKALEYCQGESLKSCEHCPYWNWCKEDDGLTFKSDILTIINELESENKDYKDRCELIHDLGFDYDGSKTIEDFKILVDELVLVAINGAQVKKETERLANRITCQVTIPDDKLEEIKKECLERVEIAKEKLLKQFAERLKERLYNFQTWEVPYDEWCKGNVICGEIDETLKEFEK